MDNIDGEIVNTYSIGDTIQVSNETYKHQIAQIGGYELKWSHESKTSGLHYWRCINFNRKNVPRCHAVIYTDGITSGSTIKEIKFEHNHTGDATASEERVKRNVTRNIAISNPELETREVIAAITASTATTDTLKPSNLGRLIRYQRQKQKNTMPPHRHWCWDYYESFPDMPKVAKCQGCGQQYSNGSVSRMTKHLKSCNKFDPNTKAEIQSKIEAEPVSAKAAAHSNSPYARGSSMLSNGDDSEELCKTLEEVIKAATSAPQEENDSDESSNGFSFNLLQSGFDSNGHEFVDNDRANQLLVKVFQSGYISSRFVENDDFKKFIHVINPNYVLPSMKGLDEMIRETEE